MKKVSFELELSFIGQEVSFTSDELNEIAQHVLNALVNQVNESEDGIAPANGDAILINLKRSKMKTYKTNEQALKALLKDLGGIETAILRERILLIADMTRKGIAENPEDFSNGFVHHSVYSGVCAKIAEHLDFDK